MNEDINTSLNALIPLLRMNGEMVYCIEAVRDWYQSDGREYCKEVAEITYDNEHTIYADIGSDSNVTACFDVLGVIQGAKKKAAKIERIERNIYAVAKPEDACKPENISEIEMEVKLCGRCRCGNTVCILDRFCNHCGAPLDWSRYERQK